MIDLFAWAAVLCLLAHGGAVVDFETGGKLALSQLKGQAMLVDFFALWCNPCQAPMDANQAMLERHRADWEGKVTIVGLSLDDAEASMADAYAKMRERWADVEFYWCGPQGFESPAARMFHVSGIPHCALVDAAGTVLWAGHPAEIDVEAELCRIVDGSSTLLASGPAKRAKRADDDAECPPWVAEIAGTGPAWGAHPNFAARAQALVRVRAACRKEGVAFDALLDEETVTATPRGVDRATQLLLAGSFTERDRAALERAVRAVKALCADAEFEFDIFPVAEPVVLPPACTLCAAGFDDEAPRMVCVHCPTFLCASCFANRDEHDPTHVFMHCDPQADLTRLRFGPGTWPAGDPAMGENIVDGAHTDVACDGCGSTPLPVYRFKCATCANYDLCVACFNAFSSHPEGEIEGPPAHTDHECGAHAPGECDAEVELLGSHPKAHPFLVLMAAAPQ